jgi:hypothetical protein
MQSVAIGGWEAFDKLDGGGNRTLSRKLGSPGALFSRSVDWDPALRNINKTYDRFVTALRIPDRNARQVAIAQIMADFPDKVSIVRQLTGPESWFSNKSERGENIGNLLIGLLFPALEKIQTAFDRMEQTERNAHVAFALAAYQGDNGRYPSNLDELAPKYLPKVPGDLFSGRPLIYKPADNGYLFYSVGVNGLDEDGRWTDDTPKGDDLRVRMPVPEPKPKKPGD